MWEVNTLTLVDFLESGDIISHEGGIYSVDTLEFDDANDEWIIYGLDQEWEDDISFTIPDGHMVELMLWVEPE